MAIFMDLKGTSQSIFQIGKNGPKLRNNSGVLESRNAANSAYVDFVAQILRSAGDSLVLNEDATLAGADWKMTLARPASGMTANVTYTMPAAPVNGYYLQTDGSGNLSWATVSTPSVSEKVTVDSTTINYNDSSPVAMFTLPANAVVHKCEVIIDTPFDDAAATIEIGKSGSIDKYMAAGDSALDGAAQDSYSAQKNNAPFGSTEAIIATLTPGTATQGVVRVLMHYSIPA